MGLLERAGRLTALIVPAHATQEDSGAPGELIERAVAEVALRLPPWRRVTDYALTAERLPRTRLGKLRRHLLPDLYDRARGAAGACPLRRPRAANTLVPDQGARGPAGRPEARRSPWV